MIQSIPSAASSAPGGAVGGAGNLVTAGAVPFVASAGVLTQDASNLFWDNTNDRLGVGTAVPAVTLSLVGNITGSDVFRFQNTHAAGFSAMGGYDNSGTLKVVFGYGNASSGLASIAYIGSQDNNAFTLRQNNTERARFAPTTGNLLIGTTTDANYKLEIAASGSTGTLRVYDQTATTGSTLAVFQAGAGQSGNILSVRNSGGTDQAGINSAYYMFSPGFQINSGADGFYGANVELRSDKGVQFSGTTNATATKDTSFTRNTAAIAQIGSGGANADGWLKLKGTWFTSSTVSGLPTASVYPAMQMYVTDANATTIGSVVAGGGSNKVMVWSDGTNWKIFAS